MKLTLRQHEPFYVRPRRLSFLEKIAVNEIVADLLDKSIIRNSDSPYCSAIVLTKKKTGYRMCVDYRTLNKYLVRAQFPLPLIDDQLDNLRGKSYFTKLDLRNAFYHITLEQDSIKYTSSITPSGQYEFCRMPFGLSTSPATFTRYISRIFKDLIDSRKIQIYLDDLMIATELRVARM